MCRTNGLGSIQVKPALLSLLTHVDTHTLNGTTDSLFCSIFRLSWYQAEYQQNGNGALANGYSFADEYAFSITSPLNISKGMTVLDVGCGNGYMIGLLWKYTDIRIAGVDPLPFFIASAQRAYPDGSFCQASATDMSGM
jgi:SAM-dependent methyltransferase